MKKIVILALLILPLLFITNSHIAAKAVSFQRLRAVLTQSKLSIPGQPSTLNKEAILTKAVSMAVPFVKNVGQFESNVKFAADLFAGRFFLTDNELVYSLVKHSGKKAARLDRHRQNVEPIKIAPGKCLAIREYFVNHKGSKIDFISSGERRAPTVVSYFKGNDASKWRSGVSSYQSVALGEVYPGIEVKLKASGKNVEKVFYVSPQSNVADIKIGVSGVSELKTDKSGKLLLKTSLGDLAMRAPIAWQEIAGQRREVNIGYRILGKNQYGFSKLSEYDRDHALIIDPELDTLLASTFLGGGGSPYYYDWGCSLALDNSGNIYLTGISNAPDFPTTPGAYNRISGEVFVSKLNNDLTVLLASTLLGGGSELWSSLSLDNSGNVYVTGNTNSSDFPTTSGVFDQSYNGMEDGFVSKLNGDLTMLLASTYLGGSGREEYCCLALDSSGNVCLSGNTYSTDFPTTPGAYDRSTDRLHDVFLAKLNSDLTVLLASTFLGWRVNDGEHSGNHVYALAMDSSDNFYVTGKTDSADFPTTPEAYDPTYNGFRHYYSGRFPNYFFDSDVFVSKLDGNLTALLASTYLGSGNPEPFSSYYGAIDLEAGYSLALDNSGHVFLTGDTSSSDFPTSAGAFDQTFNNDDDHRDVFIAKFNNDLSVLSASTYLGGSEDDHASSLVLDSSGNVYLTGHTASNDFPITPEAYDQENVSYDIFVSKFDGQLTKLLASTFLGGTDGNEGKSITLDSSGNVYLTGNTISPDFPTTPGAYDQNYYREPYGNSTALVSKLNGGLTVNIDLLADRHDVRTYSIMRQYGKIQFSIETNDIPVAKFCVWRSRNNSSFALLATVVPLELQNNQYQLLDKYLERSIQYTYIVDAYNAAGELVGRSTEKTI